MNHVVVIGASLTGLAAAFWVKRAGFEVSILERSKRVGGSVWAYQADGFVMSAGTRSVAALPDIKYLCNDLNVPLLPAASNTVLKHQDRELAVGQLTLEGLEQWLEQLGVYTPKRGFLGRKKPIEPPEHNQTLKRYLEHTFGPEAWPYVAPLVALRLGSPDTLAPVAMLLPEPDRLMADPQQLLQALAQQQRLHLDTTATALEPNGLGWKVHTSRGVLEADAVVVATSATAAATLAKPSMPMMAQVLEQVRYAAATTVYLASKNDSVVPWNTLLPTPGVTSRSAPAGGSEQVTLGVASRSAPAGGSEQATPSSDVLAVHNATAPVGYRLSGVELIGTSASYADAAAVTVAQRALQQLSPVGRPFGSWVMRHRSAFLTQPLAERQLLMHQLRDQLAYHSGLWFCGDYASALPIGRADPAYTLEQTFDAVRGMQDFLSL